MPRRSVRYLAMASTEPLASISLPNSAPRRKIGKNCANKAGCVAHEGLRPVCQQRLACQERSNQGAQRREKENAPAPIGEPDQQTKSDQDSDDTHCASSSWQASFTDKLIRLSTPPAEHRDRRSTCCRDLRRDWSGNRRRSSGPPPCSIARNSHSALSFDDAPNSASLVGHDPVGSHARPARAFAMSGICGLAQQRDHAQFLHERRVEGNLVEAVEDIARRPRCIQPLARIDLDQDGIMRVALADKRA